MNNSVGNDFKFHQLSKHIDWWLYFSVFTSSLILSACIPVAVIILSHSSIRKDLNNLFLLMLMLSHILFNINVIIQHALYLCCNLYVWNRATVLNRIILSMLTSKIVLLNCNVINVTIDRLVAIRRPYMYRRLDYRFPMLCFGVSVFLSTGQFFLHFFTNDKISYVGTTCICMMAATFLSISNLYIRKVIRRQCLKIRQMQVTSDINKTREVQARIQKRELRATRLCFLIVLSFVIFWIPVACDFVMKVTLKEKYTSVVPSDVGMAFMILALWNGLVDCLLYVKCNKQLKKILKNMFCSIENNNR